ncbi:MAG TPA: protein kinase, partial [Myxococcota bacterium]|nr:protein kinase [Myxococcota bacterium]
MAPFEPQVFGKYLLIRRIALGGMAEIFLAKAMGAEGFRRDVVIKRILPSYSEDEAFITMFIDEARVSAGLHHQNIVQILDFDRIDDSYYIAMEYVEGRDLRKVLDRGKSTGKPLTPLRVAHVIADIASGLRYAHQARSEDGEPLNIVHRDVSPHNILLGYSGEVKVTDFGIAKAAARATKTRAGTVKGKCAYMSPEQARGKPLDGRSDLFALCAIAWEMLTGEKLFDGDGDFEVLNNVVHQEVRPPSSLNPAVPPDLDEIVLRGLERDLDKRWPDMGALERALRNFEFKNAANMEEVQLGPYLQELFADDIAADAKAGSGSHPALAGRDATPDRGRTPGSGSKPATRRETPDESDTGKRGATLVLDDDAPRPDMPGRPAAASQGTPIASPAQGTPVATPAASGQDHGLVATVPVGELQNEVERYLQAQAQAQAQAQGTPAAVKPVAEPTPRGVSETRTPAAVAAVTETPRRAAAPVPREPAGEPAAPSSKKGLWIGLGVAGVAVVAAGLYFG